MLKFFYSLLLYASVSNFFGNVYGSMILVGAPFGTKSHKNVYVPLVKELAKRGHQITVVTNYATPDFSELDSIKEIVIDELALDSSLYGNFFEMAISPMKKLGLAITMMSSMFTFPPMIAEKTYSHPEVKKLIATSSRFDLVLLAEVSSIICLPMAWHFKAPVIVLGPNAAFPGMGPLFGDDDHLSYVPFPMTPFSDQMTLSQRTINFVAAKMFYYLNHQWPQSSVRSIVQRLALPNSPPIDEIERNISLYFTNTHSSFSYPRTLPPQIIEVGGMHCQPAKPLSNGKLENFVSSSEAGFMVFAIGSVIHMEEMPEHIMQAFIDTFSALPLHVVWQWKGKVRSDLPRNVIAVPWLPQQDLLGMPLFHIYDHLTQTSIGHKGCKAFITHGGLNSLQEAIYHGVPVLGLPFGTDQVCNLNKAKNDGYGLMLDWKDITRDTLTEALRQLLYNNTYKAKASKVSQLFHDQLQSPLDRAAYWSEYVMRHGGVDHLRLGSRELSTLQRSLVDVYLMFFVVFLAMPVAVVTLCVRRFLLQRSVRVQDPGKKDQ